MAVIPPPLPISFSEFNRIEESREREQNNLKLIDRWLNYSIDDDELYKNIIEEN